MNRKERKELVSDVEQMLDDLDYDLVYELNDYHSNGVSIVEIEIDIDCAEDYPDDFDEELEDLVSDIVSDWDDDGWFSWDGWTLCISIPD